MHAYTAYVSVEDDLKSLFLYGVPMGKLLTVGLRSKWRSSFYRTCLYSVCECGEWPKITISVRTSYEEIFGSRVKVKMAIESFPYMHIQRM